jgi:PIN domain nuclease of toxin-antitoxin system
VIVQLPVPVRPGERQEEFTTTTEESQWTQNAQLKNHFELLPVNLSQLTEIAQLETSRVVKEP